MQLALAGIGIAGKIAEGIKRKKIHITKIKENIMKKLLKKN